MMETKIMNLTRRQILQLASTVAFSGAARFAWGREYPSRPVRLIVPFAPGGPTDVFARLVAQKLTDRLGKTFFVENLPGAGGNIGTAQAARAAADGHTILVAVNSLVINPALYSSVPYDPYRDFDPVTLAVAFGTGLSVNPSVPARTIRELEGLIRDNPGKFSYTSGGIGTPSHLLGEAFRLSANLDLPHIPFNGSNPAVAAVVAGHVPIAFTALTAAVPHIRSERLRAIAVLSPRRSQSFPDVPTAIEAGYPELDGDGWIGFLLPAGSPKPVVDLLNQEVQRILAENETKQQIAPLGFDAVGSTPESFSMQLKAEAGKWSKVIRAARIVAT